MTQKKKKKKTKQKIDGEFSMLVSYLSFRIYIFIFYTNSKHDSGGSSSSTAPPTRIRADMHTYLLYAEFHAIRANRNKRSENENRE